MTRWLHAAMSLILFAAVAPQEAPLQLDPEVFRAWGEKHDYATASSKDGRVLLIADSKRLKKHMKHVEKVLKELDASALGGGPIAREAEGSTMILLGLRDPEEFKELNTLIITTDGRNRDDGAAGQPGQGGKPATSASVASRSCCSRPCPSRNSRAPGTHGSRDR